MAAPLPNLFVKQLQRWVLCSVYKSSYSLNCLCVRSFSSDGDRPKWAANSVLQLKQRSNCDHHFRSSHSEGALDKFAKVVEKVKKEQSDSQSPKEHEEIERDDPNETFASMIRKSKLASLGEFKDRLVEGEVIEVMDDDLYIDFGGKFHCVCQRPKFNADRYHRGTKVLVSLQSMEMSSAFLGSDVHVTLLEADGVLLGLTAAEKRKSRQNTTSASSVPQQ